MRPKALLTDYNKTLIRGYHEVRVAYALLRAAWRRHNSHRFSELFRLQRPCWKMALKGEFDKLGPFFNAEVLVGEDYRVVANYTSRYGPEPTLGEQIVRRLPKIGKYMDTSFVDGAPQLFEAAHREGIKTGIVSLSLAELIRGHLQRYGLADKFDGILANQLIEGNGTISRVEYHVPSEDKGTNLTAFLSTLGLRQDGDGVMYIGDSAEDYDVFRRVSHPVVSPLAKEEFRERCRYDAQLGDNKVLAPKNYQELARELEF